MRKRDDRRAPGVTEAISTLPHAYRAAEVLSYCVLCGSLAVARCLRCGRPFCDLHAPPAQERCADCEQVYRRRADRVTATCVAVAAAAGIGVVIWAASIGLPLAIGASVGALACGWGLVTAGLHMTRWRFLANDAGDYPLLSGATLTIAPAGPDDGAAPRRPGPWVHRNRGDLPSVPMYQRTYGVG